MAEPCPLSEVLERYLRQTLPDEESDRLRPHLITCRPCQASLARMHYAIVGKERKRRRRSKGAGLKWLRVMVPWNLIVVVLMAAIIASGAIWLFLLLRTRDHL